MDFYGTPTFEPRSKDVARYVGFIREMVGKKPKDQTLSIVTALFFAIAEFSTHAFGHLETLAVLKAIRTRVEATDPDRRLSPW